VFWLKALVYFLSLSKQIKKSDLETYYGRIFLILTYKAAPLHAMEALGGEEV
jgi:hypothetical protein